MQFHKTKVIQRTKMRKKSRERTEKGNTISAKGVKLKTKIPPKFYNKF